MNDDDKWLDMRFEVRWEIRWEIRWVERWDKKSDKYELRDEMRDEMGWEMRWDKRLDEGWLLAQILNSKFIFPPAGAAFISKYSYIRTNRLISNIPLKKKIDEHFDLKDCVFIRKTPKN